MSHRRRAISLVEVLVVLMLLSIILVVAMGVMSSGTREQKLVTEYADIASNVRRAAKRLEKDIRGAAGFRTLDRNGRQLTRLEFDVPRSADPLDGFEEVSYRFDSGTRILERNGQALLRTGVTGIEVYVFDDLGRELADVGVPFTAFMQIRFELGDPDDPPAKRRKLDLTLTPRLPASQSKSERVLLERAFERFAAPEDDEPGMADQPGRRRF